MKLTIHFYAGCCIAAATALSIPATAFAADPVEDAIKARLGFFQVNKHYFGGLAAMAKGDVDYDAEKAALYAEISDYLSKMNTNDMWPEGSSNADRPGKTRALPDVWTKGELIAEKHNAWEAAATKLAATAGDGLDALRVGLNEMNDTCKDCHDTFRAKDY